MSKQHPGSECAKPKRPYAPPQLTHYGALRTLTQTGTGTNTENGTAGNCRPPNTTKRPCVSDRAAKENAPVDQIARVYAALGDVDQALTWMTRAFEERSNYIAYLAVDLDVDPLRRDPRFQALVARAGLN